MTTLVLTEGIDDQRALLEVFKRAFDLKHLKSAVPAFSRGATFESKSGKRIDLALAGSREQAAKRAYEGLIEGKYQRVGLVVDPDRDDDAVCEGWWEKEALRELQVTRFVHGYLVRIPPADVEFVPATWDGGNVYDSLDPGLRNLERVALEILHTALPADSKLVLELLTHLQTSGRATTWKTALRLFNAVRKPSVDAGFVAKAFGQDKEVSNTLVESVLSQTRTWARLEHLVS